LCIRRLMMLFGILLPGLLVADDQQEITQQEIDHLLSFVANMACEYDRNGSIHNGPEARDHINRKYEYYKKEVKTAEDFVKYSATKSKMSGRSYKILCPGEEAVSSSEWLLQELQAFRESRLN
jgi:hypothetical protein